MRSEDLVKLCRAALTLVAAFTLFSHLADAQVIPGAERKPMAVAVGNNVHCAGYVQTSPISTDNRLVGAVGEADQFVYSQSDFVWVNAGANKGVKAGDVWSVVRPKGQVRTKWTNKSHLGFYVEEVGTIEIVRVRGDVSAAKVRMSCANFLLGDLIVPFQERTAPMFTDRPALDIFAEPSGKAMGRLFMSRDHQEMVTREQIVYIDLGAEDNVRVGDYLTVFRPLGKGNLLMGPDERMNARSYGYESLTYKGGRFSNQAARKTGGEARGRVTNQGEAKSGRPELRKIVGEMVILNVKERTATALITRTAQEIHTGDWVEVQ